MWLSEKIVNGEKRTYIRPHKVDYVKIVWYGSGQGEGSLYEIGIDGVAYEVCQKLNVVTGWGCCHFMRKKDEKHKGDTEYYYCDDSIIVAAMSRFWNTDSYGKDEWPEEGYELPLLSRAESRLYLKINGIPHPGI